MTLNDIRALLGDDFPAVDREIHRQLHSDVALVDQVAGYIISSGGKRLRPLLVLVTAKACGYEGDKHIKSAAIIEFIHTATLLHDDVVDLSAMRRGKNTAHMVWGNQASVLVGDFLYSRAFQMMVGLGNMGVMSVMADATNTIAEGEVLQLINAHDPGTSEERYKEVIYRKTARLFEAGTQIAAILAEQPGEVERAMQAYGRHLGTAFQLVDDALDYSQSSDTMGKNMGDDLAEGKPTLPLIYAIENGTREQSRLIREAVKYGGLDRLEAIRDAIESTGALEYTAQLAQREAGAALEALAVLPDTEYKQALESLAEFSVERTY